MNHDGTTDLSSSISLILRRSHFVVSPINIVCGWPKFWNLFLSNLKYILIVAGRGGASEVPSNSGRLFLQEQRAPCPQVVHRW